MPSAIGLPPVAARRLETNGFVVAGVLDGPVYDRLVPAAWRRDAWLPEARGAVVLGTAGGAFEAGWQRASAREPGPDPIDDFARTVLAGAVAAIEDAGDSAVAALYADRRGEDEGEGAFADFVALAEACGLGARSRLGLLLHPTHGPWWAVRGLLLTTCRLDAAGGPAEAFDPCADCPAPCTDACPGLAVRDLAAGGLDAAACARHRLASNDCTTRCDARRACVVGKAHAYAASAEAAYAQASLAWIASASRRDREMP